MTINWLDQHIQLNTLGTTLWIGFFMLVITIVIIASMRYIMKREWLCPKCNRPFKTKWRQSLLIPHLGNNHVLRCPHCGEKSLCTEAKYGKYHIKNEK